MRFGAYVLTIGLLLSGCGYTLQNSQSPLYVKEGVQKVYIRPLVNNTYKVGVENIVFNALLKNLVEHRRVSIVTRPEEADAILEGSVQDAQYLGFANTPVGNRQVSSQYEASLQCYFMLKRPNPAPKQKALLWSGTFARKSTFASAVQPGIRGETTALINESEFDRTLNDLATRMMTEVHESMLAMF